MRAWIAVLTSSDGQNQLQANTARGVGGGAPTKPTEWQANEGTGNYCSSNKFATMRYRTWCTSGMHQRQGLRGAALRRQAPADETNQQCKQSMHLYGAINSFTSVAQCCCGILRKHVWLGSWSASERCSRSCAPSRRWWRCSVKRSRPRLHGQLQGEHHAARHSNVCVGSRRTPLHHIMLRYLQPADCLHLVLCILHVTDAAYCLLQVAERCSQAYQAEPGAQQAGEQLLHALASSAHCNRVAYMQGSESP